MKNSMRTWQQGLFLAGQESRACCVFISDVAAGFAAFVSDSWYCQIQLD